MDPVFYTGTNGDIQLTASSPNNNSYNHHTTISHIKPQNNQQQQHPEYHHNQSGTAAVPSIPIPKNMILMRGFSKVQANEEILNETRSQIESSLCKSTSLSSTDCTLHITTELPDYSFMLPDLNKFDNYKFKEYLQNDLIELPTQYALTESGHLNWWSQNEWEQVNRPLYPMVTSGDGNCLLHAASLAMWGLHDRYLILRKALNFTLEQIKENESPLWRRWKWEQMCQNRKFGLIYNEDEWSKEWKSLLKLSSYQPRVSMTSTNKKVTENATDDNVKKVTSSSSTSSTTSSNSSTTRSASSSANSSSSINNQNLNLLSQDGTVYFESLEEFHILLLAHILQRPIIVVADTMLHDLDGEPLSPVNFSGIYLPFECNLSQCHRYPLVLAYDSAHFSALVLMDNEHEDDYYDLMNPTDNNNSSNNKNNIEMINKKLQSKPPYSVIPITYASKELLPIHFSYDPGKDYDWSKFPQKRQINDYESPDGQQEATIESPVTVYYGDSDKFELTNSEKMFLVQRYLDIVKLQLYDPGPSVKRNAHLATNSSGMKVQVTNVRVAEPLNQYMSINGNPQYIYNLNPNEVIKQTAKHSINNKIQRFLNIFKRTKNKNENSELKTKTYKSRSILKPFRDLKSPGHLSIQQHPTPTSSSSSTPTPTQTATGTASLIPPTTTILTNNLFHKVVTYKTWNSLFDSTLHHTSLIGVKLNLAKPPKFNDIIFNYIESAQNKFEFLKQHHQKQQQKQYVNAEAALVVSQKPNIIAEKSFPPLMPPYQCVANRSDCRFDNLCSNCLNYKNTANLRSVTLNQTHYNDNIVTPVAGGPSFNENSSQIKSFYL